MAGAPGLPGISFTSRSCCVTGSQPSKWSGAGVCLSLAGEAIAPSKIVITRNTRMLHIGSLQVVQESTRGNYQEIYLNQMRTARAMVPALNLSRTGENHS